MAANTTSKRVNNGPKDRLKSVAIIAMLFCLEPSVGQMLDFQMETWQEGR